MAQTSITFTEQPSKMVSSSSPYPLGLRGEMSTGGPGWGISIGKMSTHICRWPWETCKCTFIKITFTPPHTLYMQCSNKVTKTSKQHTLPGLFLVCPWGRVHEFQYALAQVYNPHWASQATCAAPLEPGARTTPPSDLWNSSKHSWYIAPLIINNVMMYAKRMTYLHQQIQFSP